MTFSGTMIDAETERQRLQAWQQYKLMLAMQAAPVNPGAAFFTLYYYAFFRLGIFNIL